MEHLTEAKSRRMLMMYSSLVSGEILNKSALAHKHGVSERSIQRDIAALRCFLAEKELPQQIIFDKKNDGFRLIFSQPHGLSNDEILAVSKILLESRSLRRDEMLPILDKLIDYAVPESSRRTVRDLISNEAHHYLEPHHGKHILSGLWEIGQAIQTHQVMEITYQRMDGHQVKRTVEPVGLMFSEYYFYLTAFIRSIDRKKEFENPDDSFPTIYRLDRIQEFQILDEHFQAPYRDRFEEGEFRKRVQFMYGGKLQTVRFIYTGPSVEAVLDRLPTAEVLGENDGAYEIRAEVFGKGIDMWLRSQGVFVSVK